MHSNDELHRRRMDYLMIILLQSGYGLVTSMNHLATTYDMKVDSTGKIIAALPNSNGYDTYSLKKFWNNPYILEYKDLMSTSSVNYMDTEWIIG